MIRDILDDAAALVSLALFLASLYVGCAILASLP